MTSSTRRKEWAGSWRRGTQVVNIEIIVAGQLGDLARWALSDLVVDRRQVLLTSTTDMLIALEHLTARGVEVVAVRERHPAHSEEAAQPHPGHR